MICTSEIQVRTRMQTPIVSSPGHTAGRCGPTQIAEHKTPVTTPSTMGTAARHLSGRGQNPRYGQPRCPSARGRTMVALVESEGQDGAKERESSHARRTQRIRRRTHLLEVVRRIRPSHGTEDVQWPHHRTSQAPISTRRLWMHRHHARHVKGVRVQLKPGNALLQRGKWPKKICRSSSSRTRRLSSGTACRPSPRSA